jgi:hypothetical protein
VPAIPLGLAAYERMDVAPVTLKNLYYEKAPSNLEDQVSLVPRARLKAFAKCGAGPIKGLYRKGGVLANVGLSGSIIALSDHNVYRVAQTGVPGTGTSTLIGTLDGDFRMSAEGNADCVVLTAGGSSVYTTDGTTLSAITFPDGKIVWAVDTLNSYFLFASELGRFYWSAIGGTTVSALDYATAESQPDVLITLKVIGDELWLFGRLSIEVWQPTGDLDLPFQRIGGRIFGIGCTVRDTVQKLNVDGLDTVCWVGTDRRVYRTNPNPVRISDEALEECLARLTIDASASASNPYATIDSWNGHDFYVLHIPGEGSFAYDLHTGKWDERTSYGHPLWRGNSAAVGPNAQPLIGDAYSNQIWEMVVDQVTDGDDPVVFEFTGLLEVSSAPTRCNNVSLDLAAGTDPDPQDDPMMQMAYSDDLGGQFHDVDAQPIGRQGQRFARVLWSRLGMLRRPGRIFRWRTTLPVTVRKAKYNETFR